MGDAVGQVPAGLGSEHRVRTGLPGVCRAVGQCPLHGDPERRLPHLAGQPPAPVAAEVIAECGTGCAAGQARRLQARRRDCATVHVGGADQHGPARRCGFQLASRRQPALRPGPPRDIPEQQPRRLRRGGCREGDRVQRLASGAPARPVAAAAEPGGLAQMQVHVDEPGKQMAAGHPQDPVGLGDRLALASDSGYPVAIYQHPGRRRGAGGAGPDRRAQEQ
jgi:hypothetical protein